MARPPALALALLLLLPALPALGSSGLIDLSGPIPAGEFRAWRVRLDAPGQVEVGGIYGGVDSDQPVLPILGATLKDGAPVDAGAIFAYGTQPGVYAELRAAGLDQQVGEHDVQGGGWTTYDLQPAEYLFVLATGPGDGTVDVIFRVHPDAAILASQAGRSFWARGIDASDTAADAHGNGNGGSARAWYYSGHDFPLQVRGQLFGFVGYHQGNAAWVDPHGSRVPSFVVAGEAGDWAASFPQEAFVGPLCGGGGCFPGLDTREDPPFAIGADVTI